MCVLILCIYLARPMRRMINLQRIKHTHRCTTARVCVCLQIPCQLVDLLLCRLHSWRSSWQERGRAAGGTPHALLPSHNAQRNKMVTALVAGMGANERVAAGQVM